MGFTTLLAGAAWICVIFSLDPYGSGWIGLSLFYVTLFAFLVGVFFLIGIGYHVWFVKQSLVLFREVPIGIRRSVFAAILCVETLALSAIGRLYWAVFVGSLLIIGALEFGSILLSRRRH